MEPNKFTDRVKWLLLARMLPLVENNFNLCELGPRSTGKPICTRRFLPTVSWCPAVRPRLQTCSTIWVSSRSVSLAFDEVAGINFKEKDGVQIMKDCTVSGIHF